MINIFNHLNIDVATVGNHEFDYGKQRLLELKKYIKFPVVSTNLTNQNGINMFKHAIVKNVKGTKFLFLGLFPEYSYYENEYNIKIKDPLKTAKKYIAKYKDKADVIILVSHCGIDKDKEMANKLKDSGLDLIIGGHSHTKISKIDKSIPIPIVQAANNGKYIGKIDFTVANKKIKIKSYKLIPTIVSNVTPDETIKKIVDKELDKIQNSLETICKIDKPLSHETRTDETPLGNFAVDALVDYYNVDLAFMDSKSIRRSINGPEVCANDIYEAFPFKNNLIKLEMPGKGVIKMLEWYLNREQGRYIAVPYTLSYKIQNKGSKVIVKSVYFKDKKIEYNGYYTVIADDRFASKLERYYNAEFLEEYKTNPAEIYIKYLKQQKNYTVKKSGRKKEL